jgi:hypothetical protein
MAHPTLEIQLLSGPGAGRRASFAAPPISFGRDADNSLVVADAVVSRHHGELRVENDAWVLVNLSPNGTKIGRKLVTNKPRALHDRDVIAIGDQSFFQIALQAPTPGPAPDPPGAGAKNSAAATPVPAKAPLSKRSKLWLWISVYLGVCLIVLVVVAQFVAHVTPKVESAQTAILSDEAIAEEIRKVPSGDLNPALAQQRLIDARDLVSQAVENPKLLFKCYHGFQDALAALRRRDFAGYDDAAQLSYAMIQDRLTKTVCDAYHRACTLQSAEASADAFLYVTQVYPDSYSTIYRHATSQCQAAKSRIKKNTGLMN